LLSSVTSQITGHAFQTGFLSGKWFKETDEDKILLTDFTIMPSTNYRYGAGTGVYYPNGVTGMGYPYIGVYDKTTMEMLYAYYYTVAYPTSTEMGHSIGLRIIYSDDENAFYVSGVMTDQQFPELNMNNLTGNSKGFILKAYFGSMQNPELFVLAPYTLTGTEPVLSLISDMEISNDKTEIAYTGMTTVNPSSGFTGLYHPIVGVIDLNLVSQWSTAYNFDERRTSGVDVEYNSNNDLFVLLNCQGSPWSIMEVDGINSTVLQQPVNYKFDSFYRSKTRAHKLHCTDDELVITGNCFVDDNPGALNPVREQLLFHYKITDPQVLTSGNNTFDSYSRDVVPPGSQEAVTGYWAPENSIIQGEYTSIVGIYHDETIPRIWIHTYTISWLDE
jgi:hypothetical protein